VLEAALEGGECVVVPRANVEIIPHERNHLRGKILNLRWNTCAWRMAARSGWKSWSTPHRLVCSRSRMSRRLSSSPASPCHRRTLLEIVAGSLDEGEAADTAASRRELRKRPATGP